MTERGPSARETEWTVGPRPTHPAYNPRLRNPLWDAVAATAASGAAVTVTTKGRSVNQWRRLAASTLRYRGLRAHLRDNHDGTVTIWASSRASAGETS